MPSRLQDEIDLHIVYLLPFLAPFGALGWWWLGVPLLVPQGRIGTRAFWDYPAFGRRPWAYLLANESLVVGLAALLAGLRFAAGR